MSNPNDPAYPFVATGDVENVCSGLTKREAFAMAAMQGLLSHPLIGVDRNTGKTLLGEEVLAYVSKRSIEYADALLAELAKPTDA